MILRLLGELEAMIDVLSMRIPVFLLGILFLCGNHVSDFVTALKLDKAF